MSCFLLFAGDDYYPKGGAEDLRGRFESVAAAQAALEPEWLGSQYDRLAGWANILCLDTMNIVRHYRRGEWHDGREPALVG